MMSVRSRNASRAAAIAGWTERPDLVSLNFSEEGSVELAELLSQRGIGIEAGIWTVQEACVKAAGSGLAGRPWRIPVEVAQLHGRWRGYRWVSLAGFGVPVGLARGPSLG